MATFYLGQRVRIVGAESDVDDTFNREVIGRAGVVVQIAASDPYHFPYIVRYDGPAINTNIYGVNHAAFKAEHLAPLLDGEADEWAQSKVREVTKPVYTEPERVKEKA